jgi:uncharacterized protein YndB with AHSA1/START domain
MATHGKTVATEFSQPTERQIVARRVFDAPRQLIWDAHTSPRHVPRWMLGPDGWSMPVCEIDLRPGGTWHFVWRKDDGQEMPMEGTYREVAPPARLSHTERWGGDWAETLQTLELSEKDGRTTMVVTVDYPSREDRDRATQTGMLEGWSQSYDRLEAYLRSLR